ncbi:NAD(P)-binding protein [Aspergillus spinulosporus]
MAQIQTIALAGGTGDLGRYLHEELVKDGRFSVSLLTRKTSDKIPTSQQLPNTTIHPTDYSESSVVSILNSTGATALISLIRCPNSVFLPLHKTLIRACLASTTCKRFIPSEWAGNIEGFPDIPISYAKTRAPLRQYLQDLDQQLEKEGSKSKLEWTLFNLGWFMDYFLPPSQSYMRYIKGEFPIDVASWTYTVRGTGEEPQSWTAARDVARALVELLASEKEWERVIYVCGEWGTFNSTARVLEKFYRRTLTEIHRSAEDIASDIREYESQPDVEDVGVVEVEQWTITGATACPKEKTLRQREKYFSAVNFMSLEEMLRLAESQGHV